MRAPAPRCRGSSIWSPAATRFQSLPCDPNPSWILSPSSITPGGVPAGFSRSGPRRDRQPKKGLRIVRIKAPLQTPVVIPQLFPTFWLGFLPFQNAWKMIFKIGPRFLNLSLSAHPLEKHQKKQLVSYIYLLIINPWNIYINYLDLLGNDSFFIFIIFDSFYLNSCLPCFILIPFKYSRYFYFILFFWFCPIQT